MNRWTTIRLAIAGLTSLLMVATLVIVEGPESRAGFGARFALALIVALLPSAIFAVAGPAQPRVLRWGTIHALLVAALALFALLGAAGAYRFGYAALLYVTALVASIVAAVDCRRCDWDQPGQ
jgi:cyanate permease